MREPRPEFTARRHAGREPTREDTTGADMNQNSIAVIKAFGQALGVPSLTPETCASFPLLAAEAPAILDFLPEADALLVQAVVGRAGDPETPVPEALLVANAYGQGTGDAWLALAGGDIVLRGCFFLAGREGPDLADSVTAFLRAAAAWKETLADPVAVAGLLHDGIAARGAGEAAGQPGGHSGSPLFSPFIKA